MCDLVPCTGMQIAAHHITTKSQWTDVSVDSASLKQLTELQRDAKSRYHGTNDKENPYRSGLPALFYGPSQTGRRMAAALIGRESGLEVYSINTAGIVSKYIGETEKNMDRVFEQAKVRGWILFFDEADALFGKRTETRDSHDRYANTELDYLLEKIQNYNGLVILASNAKESIDDAMSRRFHYIINFPVPGSSQATTLKN